ncbi:MAG: hypothetical protein IJD39_01330 [Clostridia bacterium]|nr:hypothetical protein [Clostridia bacterium]
MKTRKWLLLAALVLSVAMATTGTMAYLSDTDSDVNVMTLGNVQIEQIELQRAEGVEHTGLLNDGDLVPFVKGQPLYPAYPVAGSTNPYTAEANDLLYWGPYVTAESDGTINGAGNGLWSDDKLVGALDKFVFVKNTGKSDCYYRTWLAFECPEGMEYSEGSDKEFMMNINLNDRFDWEEHGYCTIEGVQYLVMSATYKNVLAAGEISRPSLLQVVMTHNATNEDMELLGDTYEILAFTQAVQTINFPDAETALNAAFGTDHPWTEAPAIPVLVETADELVAALENGQDVVLTDDIKIDPANMSNAYGTTGLNVKNGQAIYGNGNTLDIKGAGGTWDSGINTTGGLIKDLKVTGSFRGIFINHNSDHSEPVVLENVIIDGTTYTISCDQGLNQNLIATNSTFKGWTSFAATLGEAKFVDCYFGEGNGYSFCRPYAPTEFVGCEFEAGYTVDPRAAVTFENCTLDGVALTAENLSDLVTDTAKATVK